MFHYETLNYMQLSQLAHRTEKAIIRLATKGWTQKEDRKNDAADGAACLRGSFIFDAEIEILQKARSLGWNSPMQVHVNQAIQRTYDLLHSTATDYLKKTGRLDDLSYSAVTAWNDAPERTLEQVMTFLVEFLGALKFEMNERKAGRKEQAVTESTEPRVIEPASEVAVDDIPF